MTITIGSALDEFNRELKDHYSKNSLIAFTTSVRQFSTDTGLTKLNEIARQDIRGWKFSLKEKGYSQASTALKVASLLIFLRFCLVQGHLSKNVVAGMKAPRVKPQSPVIISEEIMFLLREACKDRLRDRAILETLVATGVRVSELTGIRLEDVNFDDMWIKIRGKGDKERYVFFSSKCYVWLKRYKDTRKVSTPYLFHSARGPCLSRYGVRKLIKGIAEKANVHERIFPHKFRTTFVSVLAEKGFTDEEIMRLIGHDDPGSIDRYKLVTESARKRTYEKHNTH